MQGASALENVEHKVLKLLSSGQEYSCTSIVAAFEGKYAKGTVLKYLKKLIEDELIEEKPGSKEVRFRPRYLITTKGWKRLLREGTDQISEMLRSILTLEKIPPEKLEEWRQATRQAVFHAKTPEQRIKIGRDTYQQHYGLLGKSYWVVHNLVIQLAFPEGMRDRRGYLGFTEDGDLNMIPTEILKDVLKKAGEDFPV